MLIFIIECDFKCKICEGSAENCTECSHSSRDINNNCECKIGYF